MAWKDILNQMSSQIYERLGNEWDAARETLAMTFDPRLRTFEMIYPRDFNQSRVMQHDMTQAPKEPDLEPER